MLKRALFILCYLFAWVIFFELARIFFLLYEWQYTSYIPAGLAFQSLWYGFRMDISAAAYLTIPVCLPVIAGLVLPFFRDRKIYIFYTGIILLPELLLLLSDAEIYKAWGTRIDYSALKYLTTPAEMWASVSHLPVVWMLLGLAVVYLLLFWVLRKFIKAAIPLLGSVTYPWVQAIIVVVITGSLIIPLRGGIQLIPLNQSSAYFCDNQFANHAAINASWNFMHSITILKRLKGNPYLYMKEEEARNYVQPLFTSVGQTEQVLRTSAPVKPDIILIIWESFTEKALHVTIGGKPVLPYFGELKKEGIYFSNCYASGDRTEKGLGALLSSYPALPKFSIVNFPEKTFKLPGLGKLLENNQYTTSFYYGGEPEFGNIKSYMSAQKTRRFITKDDFRKADMNSKWGVHDNVVMKRLLDDIPRMQQPFFTTFLTLSSHEPFETPVPVVFPGKDIRTRFLNSLHYTDSCLFGFINELKKLPLWDNTLVLISADHGHYEPVTGKRADNFRIPVLWLGGALTKQHVVIDKTVSQLDMAGNLVHQLGFDTNPFLFSKNIFDSTSKGWAFFTYNDGIGFVTDSSRLLFDNAGKRVVFEEGKTDKKQVEIAKALMQVVYADFLTR